VGALVVNKTNSEFVAPGTATPVYADFFGFADLKVYEGALDAEGLEELFGAGFGER
jgi:hypothetical protein